MTVWEYVTERLDEGETALEVLVRQARVQFPSLRINISYVRRARNAWQRAKDDQTSEPRRSD